MDAYLAVVAKREVRRYRATPLPSDVLTRLLEAARAAGSSRNSQPWRFVVITDRSRLKAVSECVFAPANVAGCTVAIAIVLSNPRAAFDAGRAAQNVMIAAWALGVGSCPNTPADEARLKTVLRIPEGMTVPTVLSLGLPAPGQPRPRDGADPARVLNRIHRLPLDTLVLHETF